MAYMKAHMSPDVSFDVVYRVIDVGGRQACIYFIDGFCKDEADDEDPAVLYRPDAGQDAGERL